MGIYQFGLFNSNEDPHGAFNDSDNSEGEPSSTALCYGLVLFCVVVYVHVAFFFWNAIQRVNPILVVLCNLS